MEAHVALDPGADVYILRPSCLPDYLHVNWHVPLHDLGHMVNDQGETPTLRGIDDRHEYVALPFLRGLFDDAVLQPIRLHVDAKRYLCARGDGTINGAQYWANLSADSKRSLELQGGLMSPDEIVTFRANPFHAEAVRLRRYDEEAKDPQAQTPAFDHYLRHVPACRK